MKEGGTGLNKTFRGINLVFKGLIINLVLAAESMSQLVPVDV